MIHNDRIRHLNNSAVNDRKFVLYWMQASQRTEYNYALEYAVITANRLKKPLIVFFGLSDGFPNANLRHYRFMLEGLKDVNEQLYKQGIKFVCRKFKNPAEGVLELAKDACQIITDMGYLRIERKWRQDVAKKAECSFIQIESNVVVPIGKVSNKREYAARTIRPKIQKCINEFLVPLKKNSLAIDSSRLSFESLDFCDIDKIIAKLDIDKSVEPSTKFIGGYFQAKMHLENFIKDKLLDYDTVRNNPALDGLSNMSPYLHFGQISPVEIALHIKKVSDKSTDAYLEEMIVRRELSMNFAYYTENYDDYKCLPGWTKTTLEKHKTDAREYIYTSEQLENCHTHDDVWNAAQMEMITTGKMHGYMRMYWGKKIIEWNKTPEHAYKTALYFNDKYEIDGRDANGFCGVAWCFGNHDRPWSERKIFGTVRFMNLQGLKRKFDVQKYIQKYR